MTIPPFPPKGFEITPSGRLLEQIVDLSTPMGVAYERSIGFEKADHVHDRHMLVCPRASCRMEVADRAKQSHAIDATTLLWVPRDIRHSDASTSAIYDTLALFPSNDYVTSMVTDNGLNSGDRDYLERNIIRIQRSKWLNDLLDRYFFERVLNRHSPPGCTFFLEKQIINEVARIIFRHKIQQNWESTEATTQTRDTFSMAIRFIESNLFSEINLEQIAKAAGASASTVLRKFKESCSQSPFEYIQARRLDEALHLLKTGENSVGDIALLTGYEDFSAFSRAFRKKFGKAPSGFRNNAARIGQTR